MNRTPARCFGGSSPTTKRTRHKNKSPQLSPRASSLKLWMSLNSNSTLGAHVFPFALFANHDADLVYPSHLKYILAQTRSMSSKKWSRWQESNLRDLHYK